jgi:hypothetical protein
MKEKLNIVLVHGAFGDGSHWRHIIPRLRGAGHRAMAAQNPLTSLADDVANTRRLADRGGRVRNPSFVTSRGVRVAV